MTRNTVVFIIFLIVISTPFALLDYAHFPYSDGAEHGAAVRTLAENMLHPGDPMLNMADAESPRYVPSIFIMALVMKAGNLDLLAVLKLFIILGLCFFLVSVALFSREYFNDSGQAPWAMTFLLFFWGLGWREANGYMFSSILYTAYYPSVVAFSCAFLALYFQLRFMRSKQQGLLAIAIAVGALSFANHPVTGIFFLACSALLYLEQEGLNKKTVFCFALTLMAVLCLTALWPYYNFWDAFKRVAGGEMRNSMDYSLTRQYLYSIPLLRAGPALIGIPIVIFYFTQRRYLLLWGGCAVFGFIYLAGYFVTISLAERFIFFIMCLLQLASSRLARQWFAAASLPVISFKKKLMVVLLAALAGGGVLQSALVIKEFMYPCFSFPAGSLFPRYVNPNSMHHELGNYLHEGDVVLSDLYTSWSVPVYTGAKIVALFHTAPHIKDNPTRIRDVETFYSASATNAVRKEIIKKYGVTQIFLNFIINGKQLEPALREMGYPVVVHKDEFCIFSIPK